jgi:integrase/recombinase XerD
MAQSRPKPVGDLGDPSGMAVMMDKFLKWMEVRNDSERTVTNHHWSLTWFIKWAQQRGIARPSEVTMPVLDLYQRHLYHDRKQDGDPLSFRT